MSGRYLSVDQIDDLLEYIGVEGQKQWKTNGDSKQICCPIHSEKNPSMGVSVSKQIVHCFSCGFAGTFDYFLHKSLPDEFKRLSDAARFIRQRYKVDLSQFNDEFKNRIKRYEDFFDEPDTIQRKVKPMYSIAPFMSGKETFQYFYDRGFTEETAEIFKIGRDLLNNTVTIPVFWDDEQLAGIIGRYVFPRSSNERYKVYDFERGQLLFPLNKFEPEEDTIILVEGLFDAMWLYQIGYRNCLALMTNTMTEKQKYIITENCENLVLLLDNDERGQISTRKIINEFKNILNVYVVDYPNHGKDPCDWTPKEIYYMLGTKHSFLKRQLIRL